VKRGRGERRRGKPRGERKERRAGTIV